MGLVAQPPARDKRRRVQLAQGTQVREKGGLIAWVSENRFGSRESCMNFHAGRPQASTTCLYAPSYQPLLAVFRFAALRPQSGCVYSHGSLNERNGFTIAGRRKEPAFRTSVPGTSNNWHITLITRAALAKGARRLKQLCAVPKHDKAYSAARQRAGRAVLLLPYRP